MIKTAGTGPDADPACVDHRNRGGTIVRMRLDGDDARARFGGARVARLATVRPDGRPHIVPVVFALVDEVVYTAVDAKPKSTTALRRLANIAANPAVSVLVDHYADNWTQLWWVRADGTAQVAGAADHDLAVRSLTERYPQYVSEPPPGPVLAIHVATWTGWQAVAESDR